MSIDVLKSLPRPKSRQQLPDSAQKVFSGEIFSVFQWPQPMFDGSEATFEKIARTDSVGVLAVTKDKKIVVTHQEQPSMESFISLLGGVIDPGELPIDTAVRELHEEAGGTAARWEHWFSTQAITKIDWAMYMFIAKDVVLDEAQHLDSGEKIRLELLDFEQFLELVNDETFRDFEVSLKVLRMLNQGKKAALKKLLLE